MVKFGKQVVKHRVAILIASILLLIPSVFGYFHTRVNYDVLTYLPKDIETMQGQDIMLEDFDIGAFSMFMVDGMEDKDVAALKSKIEQVDHVKMYFGMTLSQIFLYRRVCFQKISMKCLIRTKEL